jgi:hypothetical protein
MPIILNNSNIEIQYNTGSNYTIETVKSDLYVRDTRTGISSNLFAEPMVNPSISPVTTGNHKTLTFTYSITKNVEYLAQQKTGVGGWRIVRFLPPNLGRWYQGNYINQTTFNIPNIGTPYNYTNEWGVPFGTFDEMLFGTFDMTYWLQCLKTSVLGSYADIARPIIKSSSSSTPYSAMWYNRESGGSPEDPWISITDHNANPKLIVYAEDSTIANISVRNAYGGMCVMVRDSTANTSVFNSNLYTLTFPVLTLVDINNNSNLILQGNYNVNVGHPTSSVLPTISNTSNTLVPLPTSVTSNVFVRYHLLNPIKTTEGAQWTYSSSNANVYHLGSVGIGTASPEYSLDVRGFIYSSSGGYTSSALTKWSVLSDRRIKENIVKASYDKCLENVKNIELYNFNFKDNYVNTNDRHQLGFIAQEVQQVYPKAVEFSRMIMNLEEKIDDLLTLNTTQIDYTLYGAVKCLIQKLENIKIKMEQIKSVYNITT